jgi:putative membrane protein
MKRFIIRWIILTIAMVVADQLFSGIECTSAATLFIASLVLTTLNTFVKPLLLILAAPLLILSLGLFYFILNAVLLYFTGTLLAGYGFEVHGFWTALGGSLIISIVSTFLGFFLQDKPRVVIRRGPEPPKKSDPPPGKGPVIDI